MLGAYAVSGIGSGPGGVTAVQTPVPVTPVVVAEGETLWQVARRIAPAEDPRDVVRDLVTLNRMSSGTVHVGQELLVPVAP